MRASSLTAVLAAALAACSASPPAPAEPPGPAPRQVVALSGPVLTLAAPQDFLAGTLETGADVVDDGFGGARLRRTPAGAKGVASTPVEVPMPVSARRTGHGAAFTSGHHYLVGGLAEQGVPPLGGLGPSGQVVIGTRTGPIVSFGIGRAALAVPRTYPGVVASEGRVYVLGGIPDAGTTATEKSLEYADVADLASGELTSFKLVPDVLPEPRADFATAVLGGRLYVMGGVDHQGQLLGSIISAPIRPDGLLGPFTTSPALLFPARSGARAAVVGGSIVLVGGIESLGPPLSEVSILTPDASGQVLDVRTAALPLVVGRNRPAVASAGGLVLVVGGDPGGGQQVPRAEVLWLNVRSGLLDVVDASNSGTPATVLDGAAASGDGLDVLVTGGSTFLELATSAIDYRLGGTLGAVTTALRRGAWRRVLELDRTVQVRRVQLTGAAPSGEVRAAWRAGLSAATWGSLAPEPAPVVLSGAQTIGTLPVSVPGAVVATRWFELKLDLDDDVIAPLDVPAGVTSVEVVLGPTQLVLQASPSPLVSGACTALLLELRDGEGAGFPAVEDLAVTVAVDSGPQPLPTTLHAAPGCATPLAGPVVIPADRTFAEVYARGGTAGAVVLGATPADATIPAASAPTTVAPGPAATIAFEPGSPPAAVTSGVAFTVQVRLSDLAGNPATGQVTLALEPGSAPAGGQLGGTLTAAAVGGVATFSGLTLDRVGGYQLRAQLSGGTLAATSGNVSVAPGPPATVVFIQVPSGAVAGRPLSTPVVVDLLDAAGNRCVNAPDTQVSLEVATGPVGGTIAGGGSATATAGRATYAGLTFSGAGAYALRATAAGLATPATSAAIPVSQLVIATPPAGLVSGACTALSLDLRDAAGVQAPAPADLQVAVSVQSGPGPDQLTLHPTSACDTELGGPLVIPAGQSARGFWALGGTAGAVTLAADAPGAATVTASTAVVAGPPAAIAYVAGSLPAQVASLARFSPQVRVTDGAGNPVDRADVTVALDAADQVKGATLGGTLAATTDATGQATFANLTLDKVGTYALRASVTGFPLTTLGGAVEVVPGPPARLVVANYPPDFTVGLTSERSVVVELVDGAGNLCTNAAAANVTLGLLDPPSGMVLSGTLTRATVAGVATFPGLSLSQTGSVVLQASSPGLPSASSGTISVLPFGSTNPPARLQFSSPPLEVALGACSDRFQVWALDADGRLVSLTPANFATMGIVGVGDDATVLTFYEDPLCDSAVTSVTIGATGIGTFYLKGSASRVVTVAVQATMASQSLGTQTTVRIGSAPPPPAPAATPKPLNGWACGTTAPGGGSPGLAALLGLGALLLRPRGGSRPPSRRRAALAAALALGLAAPASAQPTAAPATEPAASAAKPKARSVTPVDVPLPPPPKGLTRTPTSAPPRADPAPAATTPAATTPAATTPAATTPAATTPAPAPRKARDPRPSVAVLNVEGTLSGEKLDLAALTDVLATTVDEAGWFRVVSSRDVTAVLALERQKELLGCSADQACIAELAGALGVEYVLSASVGKVGEAYVISGRMVEAKRGTGVARASTNARSGALVRAVRLTGRKLLEGFRAGRPEGERARLALPAREDEEEDSGGPRGVALRLAAVAGLAPGAAEGARRSVGVEAGLGWRLGTSWDLVVTGVGGPSFGGRVAVYRALLDGGVRLSVGLRGAAWPGASAYGGGPALELAVPLGRSLEVVGHAAGEGYAAKADQGSFAVLGGVGISLKL